MEENELFGETHEQEENGLFGRRHQAEQLNLCGVVVPKGTLCGCGAELIKDAVGIEYCGNTLCKHK